MKIRSLAHHCIGDWPFGHQSLAQQLPAEPFRIADCDAERQVSDGLQPVHMFDALMAIQKEMEGEAALKIAYSEDMFKVPDAAAAVRDYAGQGFNIVLARGSQYGSSVQEIAKDFPKTAFAWGTHVDTFGLPNVLAYTAAAEQGGYVNGVLAARLTKTKVIGVTGPVEIGDATPTHLRLHTGCRVGGSLDPGCQDLDGFLLGCGIDGGGGQNSDCRWRRHTYRFVPVGSGVHRGG